MYFTTTEKVLTAITGTNFTDKTWSDYANTNAYKIVDWFFGGGSISSIDNILAHLKMANAIINNGKNTFYAADLFETAGRYVNGLDMNRVIRPTGNTRKVFVPLGSNNFGKMVDAHEWELTMDITDFTTYINALRSFLIDVISNTED